MIMLCPFGRQASADGKNSFGRRHGLPRLAAAMLLAVAGTAGHAAPAEKPAPPSAASMPQQQPAAEQARVEGFRSARWSMDEAQVKAAIHKDFGIAAAKVHTEENASERTTVLEITVDNLLEGAGKARVSYILGYSTKRLIQVNIVWGTTVDHQAKPESVVAAANQLRTLFLTSGYDPKTIASNVATGAGAITVFQGEDSDKHLTILRLASAPAPTSSRDHSKTESGKPTVVLLLSYVENPQNPDVYRLKKGQF